VNSTPNHIRFRVAPLDDPLWHGHLFVQPEIDGQLLAILAQAYQLSKYSHEAPYAGLRLPDIEPASEHFSGDPTSAAYRYGSRVQVLGCTCGIPSCWPLVCRIDVSRQVILWHDFANPHRGPGAAAGFWPFEGFGPFRFSPQQYEHALRHLAA